MPSLYMLLASHPVTLHRVGPSQPGPTEAWRKRILVADSLGERGGLSRGLSGVGKHLSCRRTEGTRQLNKGQEEIEMNLLFLLINQLILYLHRIFLL